MACSGDMHKGPPIRGTPKPNNTWGLHDAVIGSELSRKSASFPLSAVAKKGSSTCIKVSGLGLRKV